MTHRDDVQGTFTCDICKKSFNKLNYLNSHKIIHTGQFSCDICKKSFTSKSNLQQHIQNVHGEVKFSCNICDKLFSTKQNLKRHEKLHSDLKLTSHKEIINYKMKPCQIRLKNCNKTTVNYEEKSASDKNQLNNESFALTNASVEQVLDFFSSSEYNKNPLNNESLILTNASIEQVIDFFSS